MRALQTTTRLPMMFPGSGISMIPLPAPIGFGPLLGGLRWVLVPDGEAL